MALRVVKTKKVPANQSNFSATTPYYLLILALLVPLLSLLPSLFSKLPILYTPIQSSQHPLLHQTRILTNTPLIIHISAFLTPAERHHILQVSRPLLRRSATIAPNGTFIGNSTVRTSSSAYLFHSNDSIIEGVRQRASEFQGYIPVSDIEMQVTAYAAGQFYRPHVDWFGNKPFFPGGEASEHDRLSTIFAILSSNCSKCGTQFPLIGVDYEDQRWCDVLDCGEKTLTTRNVEGAALYWRNLDENGKGRKDTLHAGLPAGNGTKVGLNIWTMVRNVGGQVFDE